MDQYLIAAIAWPAVSLLCLLIMLYTQYRSRPGAYASGVSFFTAWTAIGEAPIKYWWIAPIYVFGIGLLFGVKLFRFIIRTKR